LDGVSLLLEDGDPATLSKAELYEPISGLKRQLADGRGL
jgi:hypothetical protein